jgi:hypothetical protein
MWADKYMMIPFRDGGRDWSGVDCFGAYALILAEENVMKLPLYEGLSYGRGIAKCVRAIELNLKRGDWIKVCEGNGEIAATHAEKFDAVMMSCVSAEPDGKSRRVDLHIGCALGSGWLLHTDAPSGPRCYKMNDPEISGRIRAVYRPRILCPA